MRRRSLVGAFLVCLASVAFGAPTISKQPEDVMVTAGQNATFTVAATGQGILTYQWRRLGAPINGATATTYVLPAASRSDASLYDVVVRDGDGPTASRVAQLRVAPKQYPQLAAPDPSLHFQFSGVSDSANVNCIQPLADGGALIGGIFAAVNGRSVPLLARVTSDYRIDDAYKPQVDGRSVNVVIELPDRRVVVGGEFSFVNGTPRAAFARLNADGTLDERFAPAWNDVISVFTAVLLDDGSVAVGCRLNTQGAEVRRIRSDGTIDAAYRYSASNWPFSLSAQHNGKVLLVGIEGKGIMRLNADATEDPTFRSAVVRSVTSVVVDPDDNLIVQGYFRNAGDVPLTGLARLRRDGELDATFLPKTTSPSYETSPSAIFRQADGKIVVIGSFTKVNGVDRSHIARLNADGSLDNFVALVPHFLDHVAVLKDGNLLASGVSLTWQLVRILGGGGAPVSAWNVDGVANIRTVVPVAGGKFIAAGTARQSGARTVKNLVRFNRDWTIDTTFNPPDFPYSVAQIAVLGDGRIVVACENRTLSGMANPNPVLLLRADGSADPTFSTVSSRVKIPSTIAVTPDNKFLIAGTYFPDEGGMATGAIVKFNVDGTIDTTFAQSSSFARGVERVLVQPDGKLVLCGGFSDGSVERPVIRLNADGTIDSSFQCTINATAKYLEFASGGKMIVAQSEDYQLRGSIWRLNPDGSTDSTFSRVAVGAIAGILVQEDDSVIVYQRFGAQSAPPIGGIRLRPDGTIDPTFRLGRVAAADATAMAMEDNGQLVIATGAKSFPLYVTKAVTGPTISQAPAAQVAAPGSTIELTTATNAAGTPAYQWYRDGQPIAGATESKLTLSGFNREQVGAYSVTVTDEFGMVTSSAASVDAPQYAKGRIINLSVRSDAGTDAKTLIVGVVLGGAGTSGTKPLLIRGVGPTLSILGVPDFLPDPVLKQYDSTGFMVDQNDDWRGVFDFNSVGAFGYHGSAPKDAAIYNPYAPAGGQTVHLIGKGPAAGVALAEIYDASPGGSANVFTPRLINGSARTQVGKGTKVLILGFVIGGNSPVRVLVRGVGPRLAAEPFNVGGTLADPKLELYNGASVKVLENDNWGDGGNAAVATAAFNSVGAFLLPEGSKDAALVAELPPGNYTAMVSGVGETTGVGLVELYELP